MIVVWGECGFRSEGAGAGEGNRTLVFSLEAAKFRNLPKGHSDILQPSG